jgi:hypothetical protein
MAKKTIYISEEDTLMDIVQCCPLAIRILERRFGQNVLKRDDLDKLSLREAVNLCGQEIRLILVELNRICI